MLQEIGGLVFHTGLRPSIGDRRKAETLLIEIARLFGVSNIKLDVVYSFDR